MRMLKVDDLCSSQLGSVKIGRKIKFRIDKYIRSQTIETFLSVLKRCKIPTYSIGKSTIVENGKIQTASLTHDEILKMIQRLAGFAGETFVTIGEVRYCSAPSDNNYFINIKEINT